MSRKATVAMEAGIVSIAIILALWFIDSRTKATAKVSPCVRNLEMIEACKVWWTTDHNKKPGETITWDDLKDELAVHSFYPGLSNGIPICPQGGTYMLGAVGEDPRCSLGGEGHSLIHGK